MTEIIGVRFKDVGKIYYFSPNKNTVKCGNHVIVETARAVSYTHLTLPTILLV